MEIAGSTRVFALLGDPVTHSLSPAMQNLAFRTMGLDAVYVPVRCSAAAIPQLMASFARQGVGWAHDLDGEYEEAERFLPGDRLPATLAPLADPPERARVQTYRAGYLPEAMHFLQDITITRSLVVFIQWWMWFGQTVIFPDVHAQHCPHGTAAITCTRSPGVQPSTVDSTSHPRWSIKRSKVCANITARATAVATCPSRNSGKFLANLPMPKGAAAARSPR